MAEQDAVREFFRDDEGYLDWLAAHPDGFVVNIAAGYSTRDARLHLARCHTINGRPARGSHWTDPYRKLCADKLAALDGWSADRGKRPIVRCGTCHPSQTTSRPVAIRPSAKRLDPPVNEGHYNIHGPTSDDASIEARATDYIRFERLPPWQRELRQQIRGRCRQLVPASGQVLHATFFGPKRPNADVENLLLYNIGTFNSAGRNGIRFEYGHAQPPTSDDPGYGFCYRYTLEPRSDGFSHWHKGRTVASFDWTDLGNFKSERQLAQVWLALWRGEAAPSFPPIEPDGPFGIRVEVRSPSHRQPVWGGLMKGIVDGVICAFQTHGETQVAPQVLERLARSLDAQPDEIQKYLLDRSRSVLGVRPRLVSPYQSGVKWDPSDHLCVAGELLAADDTSAGNSWEIKGELFELRR